jgi:hypothetical protein
VFTNGISVSVIRPAIFHSALANLSSFTSSPAISPAKPSQFLQPPFLEALLHVGFSDYRLDNHSILDLAPVLNDTMDISSQVHHRDLANRIKYPGRLNIE